MNEELLSDPLRSWRPWRLGGSTLSFLTSCALAFVLSGCAPKWAVLAQATPNPFVGQTEFVVMPVDYTDLHVGDKAEAEYLAGKGAGTQASFQGDKAAMNENFIRALMTEAADEGIRVQRAAGEVKAFIVRAHVGYVEPGFYAVVMSAPSEIIMRVKIETREGQLLDEIEVRHSTDSSSGMSIGGISLNPSSGGRLRDDAEWIGEAVGEYLATRVNPED